MTKRFTIEVRDCTADDIEKFARQQGVEPAHAVEQLLVLGNFVINSLANGQELLLKTGDTLEYIEWNIPEPHQPDPSSPPTLRIIK